MLARFSPAGLKREGSGNERKDAIEDWCLLSEGIDFIQNQMEMGQQINKRPEMGEGKLS